MERDNKIIDHNRQGFTLLELIVFVAIFSFTIIGFISILISITKVQVKQGSSAEVSQQSQYILQTLQYYVEKSSLVEADTNTASSSLKLRMSATAEDPTLIFASGTTIYIKVGSGEDLPLTSDRVSISNVTFILYVTLPVITYLPGCSGVKNTIKLTVSPAGTWSSSVSIVFTISYNPQNLQQQFSQAFSSSVMRVNAATFDSNVNPNAGGTLILGDGTNYWKSINGTIYFNGENVGIATGVTVPNSRLQIAGGDVYVSNAGSGVILTSPGGTCYRLAVTDGGTATTTSLACP